jgi:hypothetical protein
MDGELEEKYLLFQNGSYFKGTDIPCARGSFAIFFRFSTANVCLREKVETFRGVNGPEIKCDRAVLPFGQIQFAHPKRFELFNISLLAA